MTKNNPKSNFSHTLKNMTLLQSNLQELITKYLLAKRYTLEMRFDFVDYSTDETEKNLLLAENQEQELEIRLATFDKLIYKMMNKLTKL